MISSFHRGRRLSGAMLLITLIGLPFLRIGGESAFRFDIPRLRLLFFGAAIGMEDFFIILVAVIFLTFFALFATSVFGRIWCGWLCPQTVLMDFTSFWEMARKRGPIAIISAATGGAFAGMLISASMVGYFVSPYDFPVFVRGGGAPAAIIVGSWTVLSILLFLDLIAVRRKFCATVCPYAKIQSVLFDDRTLLVAFDDRRAEECMKCSACVRACPVGIDIRNGPQMACIHCAECVDACTERMAAKNRTSLINYSLGLPRYRGTGLRVNVLITGAITAVSLAFMITLMAGGAPFDMSIALKFAGEPSPAKDGSVTNAYTLTFRNKSATDLELDLSAAAPSLIVRCTPEKITLRRNGDLVQVPVSLTIQRLTGTEQRSIKVVLIAIDKQLNKRAAKEIYFILPKTVRGE
jgi:polyferredoxin